MAKQKRPSFDFWQAEVWNIGDEERPLWLAWTTCPDLDWIMAHTVSETKPDAKMLWDTLCRSVKEWTARGEPQLPTELMVVRNELLGLWESLKPKLEKLGITLKSVAITELWEVDGVPEL